MFLRLSFIARYSDNPPYNPGYSDPSDYYGGYSGPEAHAQLGGSMTGYPVGTVPPPHSHVPLLHQAPPRSVHKWSAGEIRTRHHCFVWDWVKNNHRPKWIMYLFF